MMIKASVITSPTAPATIRITPTTWMSIPATVAVTANLRIAPTAIRKIENPTPMRGDRTRGHRTRLLGISRWGVDRNSTTARWLGTYSGSASIEPRAQPETLLPRKHMRRLTIILAVLIAAALAAPAAQASSKQLLVMQDDALLYRNGPVIRDQTLDEFKALGTDVVKVQVYWREVAPAGRRKPAGFVGTDPASYDWSLYDGVVDGIVSRGIGPMLPA